MFFPDKIRANQEARRVLRTNGHYLLVTFNRLELNPIAKAVEDAVSALFAHDPFDYMERGPISHSDPGQIRHDLLAAGFTDVEIETIKLSSRVNARDAAQGLVFGLHSGQRSSDGTHQLLTVPLRLLLRRSYVGTVKTPQCQRIW
jgi:hypothetical protein